MVASLQASFVEDHLMWLPDKAFDLFKISQESVNELRAEVLALRSERDILKQQLITTNSNFEWLRLRVNQLEVERAGLLEKATGIKTAVPEIVRTASPLDNMINSFSFEDVGDTMAKKLGLPSFDS